MIEEMAALIYSMIFSSCKNDFYFRIFELQWAFLCLQVFFFMYLLRFLGQGLTYGISFSSDLRRILTLRHSPG